MAGIRQLRGPVFRKQEGALFLVTLLWGSTFFIIRSGVSYSDPLFFVGFRFLIATLISAILFGRFMKSITAYEFFAGTTTGFGMFLIYSLQTAGLQTIPSSQSAFITVFYVPMVPILQWLFLKKSSSVMSWVGIGFACVGLLFIFGQGLESIRFSKGEMLTFLGAVFVAIEIIMIGLFANKVDSRRVTIIQLFSCSFFSFLCMFLIGENVPEFSWIWLNAAVVLALMSVVIQSIMNWAQKSVSPTRATLIYASEPVWAAIIGRFAGEYLPISTLFGGALILTGIVVSQLQFSRHRKKMKSWDQRMN